MTPTVIRDIEPLEPEFVPKELYNRDHELDQLRSVLTSPSSFSNLHLYGPRGTGKTHLVRHVLDELPDEVMVCFVSCDVLDTQYKVLKQLCRRATGEPVPDGYHASDLQRLFEERTDQLRTVIVLDEIGFLLLNDGDDLLYYLSRVQSDDSLSLVTISCNHPSLRLEVEERTYSTLHPEVVEVEPYSTEGLFRILKDRAQHSLESRSLHREALTSIAASTENAAYALEWLKAAAQEADTVITEDMVHRTRSTADRNYASELLREFSMHHTLLYEAIVDVTDDGKHVVRSGTIYEKYRETAQSNDVQPLSERRVSDFLKHLELLQLIEAEYHYGGDLGKTREISLSDEDSH